MTSRSDSLSPERCDALTRVAQRIGHEFGDLGILHRALTHSSLGNAGRASYERLEFLGDAILGFLVAEHLHAEQPEIPQGELTDRRAAIVSRKPLAKVASRLQLVEALDVGRGLSSQELGSERILADLVEAVIGAIHLDGGLEATRAFVEVHLLTATQDAVEEQGARKRRDAKSRLLHYTQSHGLGQPEYLLLDTDGPDHQRTFHVEVRVAGNTFGTGSARAKQAAEKQAAEAALERLPDDPTGVNIAEADGA